MIDKFSDILYNFHGDINAHVVCITLGQATPCGGAPTVLTSTKAPSARSTAIDVV